MHKLSQRKSCVLTSPADQEPWRDAKRQQQIRLVGELAFGEPN
jgi:hypothetical protein